METHAQDQRTGDIWGIVDINPRSKIPSDGQQHVDINWCRHVVYEWKLSTEDALWSVPSKQLAACYNTHDLEKMYKCLSNNQRVQSKRFYQWRQHSHIWISKLFFKQFHFHTMEYIQLTNGGFYSSSALQVDRVLYSKKTVRVVAASSITDSSNRVAVKEYAKLNPQILNEIVVMRTCHHVNIMSMEKAVFSARDNSISIIMPLCSRGTLTSRIQSGMDRETITSYFI